jgi:RNA polymerase sigma-70 factor (ECF subfamily)
MLESTPRVNPSVDQGANHFALRSLFDEEEAGLLRYAFSLTGRREVAEEIVQEAFLKLHTRWDEVDSPRNWLFRSVRNRAFTYLRDNKRERLTADKPETPSEADRAAPDVLMQRMESLAKVRNTLQQLSDEDRQLVKLKYFENLKYREISERTGLSVSNVGYRLHHILKQLGKQLRQLGIDG